MSLENKNDYSSFEFVIVFVGHGESKMAAECKSLKLSRNEHNCVRKKFNNDQVPFACKTQI